jgi:L-arabinokinase
MGGIADYAGATVLQWPIAEACGAAWRTRRDRELRIVSLATEPDVADRRSRVDLDELLAMDYSQARAWFARDPAQHWASYVAGLWLVLHRELGQDFAHGADLVIASEVPEGAGVSSSAALEVAVVQALFRGLQLELPAVETAALCRKTENAVAGAACGIMDQMTSLCGAADRLLALRCQPAAIEGQLALPQGLMLLGIDTGVEHRVAGSRYGEVRLATFMGCELIANAAHLDPDLRAVARSGYLANLDRARFEREILPSLPERLTGAEFVTRCGAGAVRRAQALDLPALHDEQAYPVRAATAHPVNEQARIAEFRTLLGGNGNGPRLGELMLQSHQSYTDCGLGSPATDALVDRVWRIGPDRGVFGARVTGGGCGGTVVVLARDDAGAVLAELAGVRTFAGSSPGALAWGTREVRLPDRPGAGGEPRQ